ncbi:hypothetical protein [Adhaeribacter pallidiroseus]|uniref:Uncharacterized protein n=1 Tax=Adhaeribacter pallidiroseus TaxID=2072847 RepID=A0A369QIG9_9BACT|nr:hypothetical protein [Adhaeribacter pallidiroseus]RDC62669.1 hypothetical protein AHMF7616_01263 [Adhaeribacter pallidiroseus]
MVRQYSPFFSITLSHEYFLNRQCPDLHIWPTADCQVLFRRLNIQGRQTENHFQTFISVNDNQEPFMNARQKKFYRADYGQQVFRFYVTLKDPFFLNYTNIQPTPRKLFYFSNLANNAENNFLYLTAPVEEYTVNKLYPPGSLVREARTGQVYEANTKHIGKKKTDLTDPALWAPKGLQHGAAPVAEWSQGKTYQSGELVTQGEQVWEATQKQGLTSEKQLNDPALWINRGQGQLQYPTVQDQVAYSNGSYALRFPEPVKKAVISILGFNYHPEAPAYDTLVSPAETRTFDQPVDQVTLNLTHLKPGKYQIKVNQEISWVYYDPAVSTGKILGVIEIFNHLPDKNPYALLTDAEKIKKTKFCIWFPTRRVLWKYIRKDTRAQTITDVGSTAYQFKLNGDQFISTVPIPLSESVLKTLKLEFSTADFKVSPLPNPPVQRFGKCHQNDYDYLCSEVYLNY